MTAILKIGRARFAMRNDIGPVENLYEEASRVYRSQRDKSGEGGSTFPEGVIVLDNADIARISYNGRVWPMDAWRPDQNWLWSPS